MTTTRLRDAAQQHAQGNDRSEEPASPATADPRPANMVEPLLPVDAPEGIDDDPADVPVQVALARAMRDLGRIAKLDKFEGGNAGRYNFRGVDRVVNAAAPVLRKHGLIVLPEVRAVEYRDIARVGGGRSHECVVTVAWHWTGPRGDQLVAVTQGEALDTSDKATAKAQSVAWRVCLIETLAIPTGDPDPDSVHIERGEAKFDPVAYRDEALDPRTSVGRLQQMVNDLRKLGHGAELVTNEIGDEEKLGNLLLRLRRERQRPDGDAVSEDWPDADRTAVHTPPSTRESL